MKSILQVVAGVIFMVGLLASPRIVAQGANITGDWTFTVQTDMGAGTPAITFKQDGEKLTGKYTGQLGAADLTGTVKGNDVKFTFTLDAQGKGTGAGPDGAFYDRFRTWKESLRDTP